MQQAHCSMFQKTAIQSSSQPLPPALSKENPLAASCFAPVLHTAWRLLKCITGSQESCGWQGSGQKKVHIGELSNGIPFREVHLSRIPRIFWLWICTKLDQRFSTRTQRYGRLHSWQPWPFGQNLKVSTIWYCYSLLLDTIVVHFLLRSRLEIKTTILVILTLTGLLSGWQAWSRAKLFKGTALSWSTHTCDSPRFANSGWLWGKCFSMNYLDQSST